MHEGKWKKNGVDRQLVLNWPICIGKFVPGDIKVFLLMLGLLDLFPVHCWVLHTSLDTWDSHFVAVSVNVIIVQLVILLARSFPQCITIQCYKIGQCLWNFLPWGWRPLWLFAVQNELHCFSPAVCMRYPNQSILKPLGSSYWACRVPHWLHWGWEAWC